MITNGLNTSGFCAAILDFWNVMYPQFYILGAPMTNIAFSSPNMFRKSHESALLDLWQFHISGDESGLRYFTPLAIRGLSRWQNITDWHGYKNDDKSMEKPEFDPIISKSLSQWSPKFVWLIMSQIYSWMLVPFDVIKHRQRTNNGKRCLPLFVLVLVLLIVVSLP